MDIQNIPSTNTGPDSISRAVRYAPVKASFLSLIEPVQKIPGNYLDAVSHEIRNPLTNINLAVGLLQEAIKEEDLKMYLGIIMRSSIRINDLLNDILKTQVSEIIPVEYHSFHGLLDEVLEIENII